MQGYFVVYKNEANEKFDIKCELHPAYAKDEIPSEQQDLYLVVESTNNIIKALNNTKDETKIKYFEKLLSLSQAGLVGETAQPKLALKSLEKLKEEIVLVEGQRIKNDYMKRLGLMAVIGSCFVFFLYLLLSYFEQTYIFAMYAITFIGSQIGTWISFGARKFMITFEQLSLLEEDMMSPWIRLLYIGVCSIVFTLFLNIHIISIGIGEISTNEIKSSVEIQMAIGILCGLVESKIGINIYKKAVEILS